MRLHTQKPLWPYVGILLSLFVFSLAAPRAWRGIPQPDRHESVLAADTTIGRRLVTKRRGIVVTHVPSAILPQPDAPECEPVHQSAGREAVISLSFPETPSSDTQTDISNVEMVPTDREIVSSVVDVAASECCFEPSISDPVFAIALPDDDVDDDLQRQIEWCAPDAVVAETPWTIDLPPLDIDGIRRRLVERGRKAARSTSRSVTSVIHQAVTMRRQWAARSSTATVVEDETSVGLSPARVSDGRPPEPPGSPEVVVNEPFEPSIETDTPPRAPSDPRKSDAWREPKPIRLTDPSDRLAMRVIRPAETGEADGPSFKPMAEATDQPAKENGQVNGAVFAHASALISELTQLADQPYSAAWANGVLKSLRSLETARVEDAATGEILGSLATAAKASHRLALGAPTASLQLQLHRLRFAMVRRIDLYRAVVAVHRDRRTDSEEPAARLRLAAAVAELRSMTDKSPNGAAWREYLLLDELAAVTDGKIKIDRDQRLDLLRRLFSHLASEDLTDSQQEFIQTAPITRLRQAILHWLDGPVDIERLLRRIERYEESGSPAMGQAIEADRLSLEWSNDKGSRQLAGVLARHFRNANVRLAVSNDFLNRLIPQPNDVSEPINDFIAGATVNGRSITLTKIGVHLVPDPNSWKIQLEASGLVGSNTSSTSGPATFRTDGNTKYVAKKLFVISRDGISSEPTVADAKANKRLRGIRTRFDNIPLFNSVVRSIAIREHDKVHFRALAEMRERVASKARQRLDQESSERVAKAEEQFREKILVPLESLALHPETVDLQTNEQRMIVRVRLTGDGQVAAHTPRHRAPSDSELSVQFHESALNNTAAQLRLEGRTFTLPELHRSIYESFGREDVPIPDDLPATARVTFAKHDAIRVRCQDGRLRITLSIAKVHHRRTTYRNFKVHAVYGPRLDRLQMQLARDGVLSIEGRRLRPGAHIALQGVFVKLFSTSRPMTIIAAKRNEDARLKDLMITQCVIDDGWMSVAIGLKYPKRVAHLKRSAIR